MVDIILKSIILGFMLSVFIGPIFFLLIEASTQIGVKGGYQVLIGALLSDLLYIGLSYLFIEQLLHFEFQEQLLKMIGGIIFSILGIVYFIKPTNKIDNNKKLTSSYFLKSFLINTFNPSVFFFWIAAISYGRNQFHQQKFQLISYLLLAILVTLIIDSIKIYFSIYLTKAINFTSILKINRITGLALFIWGISLIIQNVIL